jgi:hypothetical protein
VAAISDLRLLYCRNSSSLARTSGLPSYGPVWDTDRPGWLVHAVAQDSSGKLTTSSVHVTVQNK